MSKSWSLSFKNPKGTKYSLRAKLNSRISSCANTKSLVQF